MMASTATVTESIFGCQLTINFAMLENGGRDNFKEKFARLLLFHSKEIATVLFGQNFLRGNVESSGSDVA